MGQQQLLLIALSVVVVGLFVVGGVKIYESYKNQSAKNVAVTRALTVAQRMKQIRYKPDYAGGEASGWEYKEWMFEEALGENGNPISISAGKLAYVEVDRGERGPSNGVIVVLPLGTDTEEEREYNTVVALPIKETSPKVIGSESASWVSSNI